MGNSYRTTEKVSGSVSLRLTLPLGTYEKLAHEAKQKGFDSATEFIFDTINKAAKIEVIPWDRIARC